MLMIALYTLMTCVVTDIIIVMHVYVHMCSNCKY